MTAGEFLCRMCVLGARLSRVEVENEALVTRIERLHPGLKGERDAAKAVEEGGRKRKGMYQ